MLPPDLSFSSIELRWDVAIAAVYLIVHAEGIYIGGTEHYYNRHQNNLSELRRNKHHCRPLQEAYNRDPHVQFKAIVVDSEHVFDEEARVLKWYRDNGCNVFNQGGDDVIAPGKGKPLSAETKEKLRQINLNRCLTANRSPGWAPRKGHVTSQETRDKIRDALVGIQKKDQPIMIEGIHYSGILEAVKLLKLPYYMISNRVRSDSERFKEWRWVD
jgi:hypothetical protein